MDIVPALVDVRIDFTYPKEDEMEKPRKNGYKKEAKEKKHKNKRIYTRRRIRQKK